MSRRIAGSAASFADLTLLLCSCWLAACTSNPYFIGAACSDAAGDVCASGGTAGASGSAGAGGSGSDLHFAVDLDQSGTSHLKSELSLSSGSVDATLRLRGETATADDWPSDQGPLLVKSRAEPVVQLEAPFTDGTRAVGLLSDAETYVAQSAEPGAVDADDFALELVLRAVPGANVVSKRDGGAGWVASLSADGQLTLELTDAQRSLRISSEPLTPRAWYHCLVWVSREQGGQAFCNGRAGPLTDLGQLGSLHTTTPLALGGGTPQSGDATELAHVSLFQSAPGGLGAQATWETVARRRFFELTGVSPRVARGSLLPLAGLRDSPAYLDLQRGVSGSRHLYLVGPDWPRVTCRADSDGVRDCGYLSEPKRTRWLSARPEQWSPGELTLAPDDAAFADGSQHMTGLVASTTSAAHTLSTTGTYGGARQALSFFARAGQGQLVGVAVSGHEQAVFDVAGGVVVAAPSDLQASIEAWGDGLFRCAVSFEPDPGALTYELQLLNDADGQAFAGDGQAVWLDVAGLQLDVGGAYAGSLLAADNQAGDQLSFVGDDGNLPTQGRVVERFRVLLPEGPRLTDQAVLNLNRGGEFENQVQLYVTGDSGALKFWALSEGATHWAFTHPSSVIDGRRHQLEAGWDTGLVSLTVDGNKLEKKAQLANEPAFQLDRIDVSYSSNSSGSLEGLVAGIEIADH